MDYNTLFVGTVPLMIVVFGLVEFVKSFGLSGNILTLLSMLLGITFGICYQIAAIGMPSGFTAWFVTLTFGLFIGLVASGFYKFAAARFPKAG